ncbi:MAG TPA: NAD(P)-dependent oxidoreductase [Steroidobacteraceae bacterium]
MRIFVTGATGALGSRLLPLLVAAGHSVVGVTHTAAKKPQIVQAGAQPVVADGLDAAAMGAAVLRAAPEVIVHEMTALRGVSDLRHFDRCFALSNRLRTEGLDHLLAAATAAGTRRVVAQSFCGWPYARRGGHVKTEEDPLDRMPPAEMRRTLNAIRYLETRLMQASNIAGLSLRYGYFYGPGTGLLDEAIVEQLRLRRIPLIGGGSGWWSLVHVDDAAAATAIAVERGDPGIYNIVDDEPAPVREWLPTLAASLGAKPPLRVPKLLALPLAGKHLVAMMTEARAGSNAKAKRVLSWQPVHRSWRTGFGAALHAREAPRGLHV